MRTDETLLARWLDDDLSGAEHAAVETELRGNADLLSLRAATRAMRRDLTELLPAAEEPPYPEFFNRRLAATIGRQTTETTETTETTVVAGPGWSRWWMPLSAAAGMAMAFWAGMLTGPAGQDVATIPQPAEIIKIVNEPGIYTPERGVDAEWFDSQDAAATVIVLSGVDAIPEDMDFSDGTVGTSSGDGAQVLVGTNQEREGDRL